MPRRPTITCNECGKPMWVGTGALPQGQARCRECRRVNPQPRIRMHPQVPPPHKAMRCAECGGPAWKGSSSRMEGEARCIDCYRASQNRRARRGPCVDCGIPSWGERCLPCRAKFQTVRSNDDYRVARQQRAHAAPGLNSYRRSLLLAKWKQAGRSCAYCPAPADTVDHVIPLVRGGTNFEGNLVPACRRCNGCKGGRLVVEWRAGRSARRMTKPLGWKRKAQPIKAIEGKQLAFNVCPECGSLCLNRYCNNTCNTRYASRTAYRLKVGIPLDAPLRVHGRPRAA